MDSLDKVNQEIEQLREAIRRADYRYYVLSDPEISDKEYDDLVKKLILLEEKYPWFITSDSPTRRVSGDVSEGFSTVLHKVKMLSLDNTYSIEELEDWEAKIKRMLKTKEEIDYTAELKIDGVSCSLTYEKGVFSLGLTRGDGQAGEDIFSNLKVINSIPLRLIGQDFPSAIEVRGEIYIDKNDFEKINKERISQGQAVFANPRNAASGSLKLLDSREVKKRNLKCIIHSFGWIKGFEFSTHSQFLNKVKQWGIRTSENNRYCKNLEEVIAYCRLWQERRQSLGFEVDGVVVKINSFDFQRKLGATLKSPRWAVAYKFPAYQSTTKIKDVYFGVGRTGIITPVALLEPIECGGVTISRSTLHNFDEIQRLDIRVGDTVLIERAGDVIPKIVKVIDSKRKGAEKKIRVPLSCPACKEKILKEKQEEVYWYCLNPDCPARLKQSLLHFSCRAAMDIEGLGESVIEELVNKKLVSSLVDIYSLGEEDFIDLPLFAEKKAKNLKLAIENSKKQPLARFLYGLGIRHIGEKAAAVLAKEFGSINRLFRVKEDDLKTIPEIGAVMAYSVFKFFSSPQVKAMIKRFIKAGLTLSGEEKAVQSNLLAGKVFLFTGELASFSRVQARQAVTDLGGRWVTSVSRNIDFVVAGSNPGSKYDKVKPLALKIIGEEEFKNLVQNK